MTFKRISREEAILFFIACIFFTIMNALSLKQGVFIFNHPDFLGMPWYELAMWGFYLVHTWRMVDGPLPTGPRTKAGLVALGYVVAFSVISDQHILLLVTAILLALGLFFFHERLDIAYTGYMVFLGATIEYTGVLSGEWHYPGDPWGGVPLWFITLWGGVGLLLRRLALPVLTSSSFSRQA
ncbi:MAG: hypothetical protein OEV28_02175 [Nitrospirota bacterium]|nr:hypothetical protein [Nitrospirota bacterium]